jgi:L-aspartate oxidase
MTFGAGVLRTASSLADTDAVLRSVAAAVPSGGGADGHGSALALLTAGLELRNLLAVGQALLSSATAREESRGNHTRTDFPETDPAFKRRLVLA